jgi:hypothetical protein
MMGTVARNVVSAFAEWAKGRPGIEPDVVRTLVDLKANYLDDAQPTRWRSGDLTDLLLELVPRKVTADDEWYAAAVPTTRAFLTRLHQNGALHRASAPLSSLLAELDEIEGEFLQAVRDPARFGMAKSILGAVGLGTDDLPDAAELDAATARFNALPFEQRDAALARFLPDDGEDDDEDDVQEDLPTELPAVRLAPVHELAAAARRSLLMQALRQLDEWLGSGRAVTATGVPKLEEARSLLETLGWEDADPRGQPMRSARDIPRLDDLWLLATNAGVVQVQKTRAVAGPARPTLRVLGETSEQADQQVLALWQAAFDALLSTARDIEGFLDAEEVAEAVLHAVLAAYEDDDHTLSQLLDELVDERLSRDELWSPEVVRDLVGQHLVDAFTLLAELGAVTPVVDDDDEVSLTPIGVHGLRTFVVAQGGDAPVVEDVAGLPGADAVEQILMATPGLAQELILEWLASRERASALAELVTVLRDLPAAPRRQLLTMLLTIDEVPSALAELCAPDPLLGPLVRAALAEVDVLATVSPDALDGPEGMDVQAGTALLSVVKGLAWRESDLPPAERDVLVVDALARVVLDVEPPVRAEDVDPDYWSLLDETTVLRMQESAHPDADGVLAAIGTGHPAGRLRKAAKKALHKRVTTHGRRAEL